VESRIIERGEYFQSKQVTDHQYLLSVMQKATTKIKTGADRGVVWLNFIRFLYFELCKEQQHSQKEA
jgi:hypothetical protein